MSIDLDKAHVIDQEGLAITDDDGELLFYVTSGEGVPYGTVSDQTLYFDKLTKNFWRSFGGDSREWVCIDIGQAYLTVWSSGSVEDLDCADELDCGDLSYSYFRSVIKLGEL